MINSPPNAIVPPSAGTAGEVIAADASTFPIWKRVPGVQTAIRMVGGKRGDFYYLQADTAVLTNALETHFPISTAASDAPSMSSEELQAALDAATDEAVKLGWSATWTLEDYLLTAHVPAAEAHKVAASTFDLYKRLARRLGSDALRNLYFDFDILDD